MKKAKLLGAIALMFALVLGAASCAQDSTPSKTESSGTDINGATDNNNTTPGGTQNSTPSGNKPSGSDTNDATDNNNTNSGGTQDSTPSGSKPSVNKPSVTKPSGTDIKDVIDSEDFSGIWKLTDAYCYIHNDYDGSYDKECTTPEEVRDTGFFSSDWEWESGDDFCIKFSKEFLEKLAAESEELKEPTLDGCLKVNDAKDEIYYYLYTLANFGTIELSLTFTKQQ